MFVLYGTIEILLPYSNSLKEKRKTINSIIDRLKKRVNISISEVGYNDLLQRSNIGFAIVSNSSTNLERFLNYIEDTLFNYFSDIEITGFNHEIIKISTN